MEKKDKPTKRFSKLTLDEALTARAELDRHIASLALAKLQPETLEAVDSDERLANATSLAMKAEILTDVLA